LFPFYESKRGQLSLFNDVCTQHASLALPHREPNTKLNYVTKNAPYLFFIAGQTNILHSMIAAHGSSEL